MDIAEIEERIMGMGCSDGGCLLRPKRSGVHTNGGCRCVPNYSPSLAEQRTIRASLTWWRRLTDSLRATLAEVEAERGILEQELERRRVELEAAEVERGRARVRAQNAEARAERAEQTLADERDKSYIRGKAVMAHKLMDMIKADFDWAVGELGPDWPNEDGS